MTDGRENIPMNDAVRKVRDSVPNFSPFQCEWAKVGALFHDLGMGLSFLEAQPPENHVWSITNRFRGIHAAPSSFSIRFNHFFKGFEGSADGSLVMNAKRRIIRTAAVLLLMPGMDLGRARKWKRWKGVTYGWDTWSRDVKALCRLAAIAIRRGLLSEDGGRCPDGPKLFSRITIGHLQDDLPRDCQIHYLDRRMTAAVELGLIDDWFDIDLSGYSVRSLAIDKAERTGRKLKDPGQNQIEPFSQNALGTILRTCIRMSELTDDVCSIMTAAGIRCGGVPAACNPPELPRILAEHRGSHLPNGSLPYRFAMRKDERSFAEILDHPRPARFLQKLAGLIQTAHMQILNFMFAARASEVSHLPLAAVEYRQDADMHVLTGPFFKKAFGQHGDLRQWPVPDLARTVMERQRKLKLAAGGSDNPELLWWGRTYGLSNKYGDFWKTVLSLDDAMPLLPQSESTVPTRFRTSAAQLAALAMTGGISVARQILNHQDVSITIGYVNASGDLHNQTLRIFNDLTTAFGERILSDYANGKLPPLAEAKVAAMVEATQPGTDAGDHRHHDQRIPSALMQLGTEDFREIAAHLGKGAKMTAPGVFCTRREHEVGRCANTVRNFNPGCCNENKDCAFRIETAKYLKDQACRIEDYVIMLDGLRTQDPQNFHGESFAFHTVMVGLLDCFHHIKGPVEEKMRDPKVLQAVQMISRKMLAELTEHNRKAVAAILKANKENQK